MSLDLGELARPRDDPPPYENIRENATNQQGGSTLGLTSDIPGSVSRVDRSNQVSVNRPTELPIVCQEVRQITQFSSTTIEQPTNDPTIIQYCRHNDTQNKVEKMQKISM